MVTTTSTKRVVRVEVGLRLKETSTLDALLEFLRSSCSNESFMVDMESQRSHQRALSFATALRRVWQLTPSPQTEPPAQMKSTFKSFRMISPTLRNIQDYERCADFLRKMESCDEKLKLNPTTGLRVHVDTKGLMCEGYKKICQNFVKYEQAIDSILPPSRRTGSTASQSYFQSNLLALLLDTKKERNDALGACDNVDNLILLMNPKGRNYKLNIQSISSSLVEFRGHSSTSNKQKITAWIALCLALVATADGKPPSALKEPRELDEEFDALFRYVVKDLSLCEYYKGRRADLAASCLKTTSTKRLGSKRSVRSKQLSKKTKVPGKRECECCFETFTSSSMCTCQVRKHWFCQPCVRRHAENQLFSIVSSKMQCLSMDGCRSHLNTIHLKRALPKKISEKLVEAQYLESVQRSKKVSSHCPKCNKSTVIVPKKETTCTCPIVSCGHAWCRLCHEAPHGKLTCLQAKQQTELANARTTIEEAMAEAYVRKCPRCHVAFVRESGCNKMTCPTRGCGTMSCYICRQEIQSTSHFSSASCPLYSNDDMTDRLLVQQAGDATATRFRTKVRAEELSGIVPKLI